MAASTVLCILLTVASLVPIVDSAGNNGAKSNASRHLSPSRLAAAPARRRSSTGRSVSPNNNEKPIEFDVHVEVPKIKPKERKTVKLALPSSTKISDALLAAYERLDVSRTGRKPVFQRTGVDALAVSYMLSAEEMKRPISEYLINGSLNGTGQLLLNSSVKTLHTVAYVYRRASRGTPEQLECQLTLLTFRTYETDELIAACKAYLIANGTMKSSADSLTASAHLEFEDGNAYKKQTGRAVLAAEEDGGALMINFVENYPLQLSDTEAAGGKNHTIFVLPETTVADILAHVRQAFPVVERAVRVEIRAAGGRRQPLDDSNAMPFHDLQAAGGTARIFVDVE